MEYVTGSKIKEVMYKEESTVEGKVYQMLETALIVSEEFKNLYEHSNELNEDYIYSESETDTYSNLIAIVLEIEKQNTDDNPLYIEDIREKANQMILEEYGKNKEYEVTRTYYKTVVVKAENADEALRIASEKDLFANVSLQGGEDSVNG